jgi:hypothetical protein
MEEEKLVMGMPEIHSYTFSQSPTLPFHILYLYTYLGIVMFKHKRHKMTLEFLNSTRMFECVYVCKCVYVNLLYEFPFIHPFAHIHIA